MALESEMMKNGLEITCWPIDSIYSKPFWNLENGETLVDSPLILLQIQLIVIFILTSLINFFLKRLLFPRVCSEILAGFILGPTILGQYFPNLSMSLFPPQTERLFFTLTRIAMVFFTFLFGVRMDLGMIFKTGRKPWVIATISLIVPLVIIQPIYSALKSNRPEAEGNPYFIISIILALTPFPVVALLLMHLKIINTELGRLALSTALISNLGSVIVASLTNFARTAAEASPWIMVEYMILTFGSLAVIVKIIRPVMFWIIKQTPEGKPVSEVYITAIALLLLVSAIYGDSAGLQATFAPFFLGLATPAGPPLATTLVEKLDVLISGLLIPLYATYSGFKLNLIGFSAEWENLGDLRMLIFISFLFKIIATLVPALYCKFPLKDSVALVLILSAKGIIDMDALMFIPEDQLTKGDFGISLFSLFAAAAVVPSLVRMLHDPSRIYTGYQKRNVLDNAINSELKILVCAHRQHEALAALKVLEYSNPCKESPVTIYGLCLQELPNASTPVLINHQLGQKTSSSGFSPSQLILDVFSCFKHQRMESGFSMQTFTAISPPKLMQEDIRWLAFDKLASLIILPFHRTWSTNGKLISDRNAVRNININVLDNAPCSVGILVDRRKVRGASSIFSNSAETEYRVALLYLGGHDDREAMALARRMAKCPKVSLTVIHFTSDLVDEHDWESMIDAEALREIRHGSSEYNKTVYRQEIVRDGAGTAALIRALEGRYDLIMVGRRHDINSPIITGLSEWSELPELGPVGDLLASSDIRSAVSVLVVQQQIDKLE